MDSLFVFGPPPGTDHDSILDVFIQTKINSGRTSSIPLVQFWKEKDLHLQELLRSLRIRKKPQHLCFEYPTAPFYGKGFPSMTDLMFVGKDYKISLEAKFTEYKEAPDTDSVQAWLEKGENRQNRTEVLESWKELLRGFTEKPDFPDIGNIEYQFLHRTASACKDVKKAYVVYQVFYDDDTEPELQGFINKLEMWKNRLYPNERLEFWIWTVQVEQAIPSPMNGNPFVLMKTRDVYKILSHDLRPL